MYTDDPRTIQESSRRVVRLGLKRERARSVHAVTRTVEEGRWDGLCMESK
jgi:hypothetical protein